MHLSSVAAENVFVRITVDPLAPTAIVCTIVGPSYSTGRFRQLYDERASNWDVDLDIHQNLLRIFGLPFFPVRPLDAGDATMNCGICLEYRHERQIAFVSCDNEKCFVMYHPACLRRWFQTLPDARTFLDVTFGTCPYCKDVSEC